MPHRTLGLEEVAEYLHLNRLEIERMVKEQDIPFERHGSRLVFRKVAIDAWASPRILEMEGERLADYHRKSSRRAQEVVPGDVMLPEMICPEFIEPRLAARTRASAIREMAALAHKTGRVWDKAGLLAGLEAREALCSTGLPGGLAVLHTRNPESYLFESAFIVLGRTVQPVPFGAPDGGPTDLFFLLACPDDRLHLHTIARVCLMAQKTEMLAELRAAADAVGMWAHLVAAERAVLPGATGN